MNKQNKWHFLTGPHHIGFHPLCMILRFHSTTPLSLSQTTTPLLKTEMHTYCTWLPEWSAIYVHFPLLQHWKRLALHSEDRTARAGKTEINLFLLKCFTEIAYAICTWYYTVYCALFCIMQCTEDGKGDIALHGEDRTARASTQLTLRQYCFAVFPNTHSQY